MGSLFPIKERDTFLNARYSNVKKHTVPFFLHCLTRPECQMTLEDPRHHRSFGALDGFHYSLPNGNLYVVSNARFAKPEVLYSKILGKRGRWEIRHESI